MSHAIRNPWLVLLAFVMLPAAADVTIESRYDMEAAGAMGSMASSGTSISRISGQKSRSDSSMQMKSKLMKTLGVGSGENVSITRLDLGVVQELETEKSRYTETSFEEMRQMLAQGMPGQQDAQQELPVAEERCVWDEGKTDFDKTGDKQTIAGLKAEHFVIRHTRSCTDQETGSVCTMKWSMDQWMAKKAPGSKEVQRFWADYAEAMGLEDFGAQRGSPGLQAVMSMFREGWEETLAEASSMRGYPVKSVIEMSIGGENCKMADGQQIAASEVFADAASSAQDAAIDQAAAETGSAIGTGVSQAASNTVGGRIAGSAAGAFGQKLAGGLFGGMKKKKKPAPETAGDAESGQVQGEVMLFRITNETLKISQESIDPALFNIPEGWQKVARPAWPGENP